MHLVLKDQTNSKAEPSVLCLEREAQTALVLRANIDDLDRLISMAFSMKIPGIRIIIPPAVVPELEQQGWKATDLVVMEKKNGK